MRITQLNKLCKSDKDVWELGGRIGKIMFEAMEAAKSGKEFAPPTESDELELDRAVYASGFAYGKRKAGK